MVGVYVEPVGVGRGDDASFTQAGMPSASAVASGTVVYNSTYNVRMRSNGTRWVPMGPFTVDQNTRSDVVTGTIAESLMHSVDVSDAVRYMGSKGRLVITGGWTLTSNSNAKNCYIRIGTAAGTAGTLIFGSAATGTSGTVANKTIYARGSETLQASSATASGANGAAGGVVLMSTLNFAPGGSTVVVSFLAAPVGSGDTVTLNWYSIVIEPGF
jgi:hypothetical protein